MGSGHDKARNRHAGAQRKRLCAESVPAQLRRLLALRQELAAAKGRPLPRPVGELPVGLDDRRDRDRRKCKGVWGDDHVR